MKKRVLSFKGIIAAFVFVAGITAFSGSAFAVEADKEDGIEAISDEEGQVVETELPAPKYDIPDNASFVYEDVEYKPIDHYEASREPMNGERISVNYKGEVIPAYYWAPGDMLVFQVSLADTDIPKFEELSQEDQDTWKSFLSEAYQTPAEAYYAEMLPTYTFYYDFDENKIVPFVEFDYGKEGKVVMMPYDKEEQGFYLEELSLSFLKLGNFEFETYQFLSINDDSCYHILSCMDQLGKVYLYQYDANGNSCARADLNMLIGLRYLAERTIALNEYIDKVQTYQDNIRKIIAGVIIFVVVIGFAFIYVVVGKKKKDDDYDDEDDDEDEEEEIKPRKLFKKKEVIDDTKEDELPEEDFTLPEIELEPEALMEEETLPEIELEPEALEEETLPEIELEPEALMEEEILPEIELEPEALVEEPLPEIELEPEALMEETLAESDEILDGFTPTFDGEDVTEGGLFYAADTEEMKSLFKDSDDETRRGGLRAFLNGDDIEDDEDDDDEDEDEFEDDDFDEFFDKPKLTRKEKRLAKAKQREELQEEEPEEIPEIQEEPVEEAEESIEPQHIKKSLSSIFDDDDEDEDDEDYEPRRTKKEKKVKEKKVKEKKVKEKPEKKKRHTEDATSDGDDEILDLEDL